MTVRRSTSTTWMYLPPRNWIFHFRRLLLTQDSGFASAGMWYNRRCVPESWARWPTAAAVTCPLVVPALRRSGKCSGIPSCQSEGSPGRLLLFRQLVDIGYVCSVCLSILQVHPVCTTCHSVFQVPKISTEEEKGGKKSWIVRREKSMRQNIKLLDDTF